MSFLHGVTAENLVDLRPDAGILLLHPDTPHFLFVLRHLRKGPFVEPDSVGSKHRHVHHGNSPGQGQHAWDPDPADICGGGFLPVHLPDKIQGLDGVEISGILEPPGRAVDRLAVRILAALIIQHGGGHVVRPALVQQRQAAVEHGPAQGHHQGQDQDQTGKQQTLPGRPAHRGQAVSQNHLRSLPLRSVLPLPYHRSYYLSTIFCIV